MTKFSVAFWGPNRPEACTVALALNAYSRCSIGLYDNYDAAISCYILHHSRSRALFTTSSYLPIILRNIEKMPALKVVVLLDRPGPAKLAQGEVQKEHLAREWAAMHDVHIFSYDEVVAQGLANQRPHIPPSSPDNLESLCYTSGTTGLPKASRITARVTAWRPRSWLTAWRWRSVGWRPRRVAILSTLPGSKLTPARPRSRGSAGSMTPWARAR